MADARGLVDRLAAEHALPVEKYEELVRSFSPALAAYAAERAVAARREVYGDEVFVRGLIEVSSHCRNDCRYCGLRRSNRSAERYRLAPEEVLSCCDTGYDLGFRTFVLQGGEDPALTDAVVCDMVSRIKAAHPDCVVTLSLGERSRASYQALRDAGADRYLLRHETADAAHYARLHPPELTLERRLACLRDLREIGYQVGCGFMVGSPGQTSATLAEDLRLVEELRPEMCGIGPFVPHHATPFAEEPAGSVELTCYLLSLLRLIDQRLLLPATTALATLDPRGRERGMLAGANVAMPNLSPMDVREKYELYDNKAHAGSEAAEGLAELRRRMESVGCRVVVGRGDARRR
ncbi:[FeFe] hydrogenase H-cluster radical SAM maturase HydE [Thermophilibacter provencensis]|uniref:[FeFe] hydrogenase H-cluster radical SAM maturase HydE n=1 Tax=Thermophilibacter provencensis TaxID=1852386 RepID=A0A921GHF1_9ACTN|nr:[FeFe] hydrogenase H-cluster radical SAM maturase HydE [Thermophilibacter provencensis]HJF45118.1 [FeFe] hydrogenase H-cluster radical SAM maturase HydE [Thermophilibacter provencensis]